MASAYFRQFAIDHGLTVDYGYMYGKYRNFYISLKETLGSTKTLCIITHLAEDKENLKKVLSVFTEEELPKYHITDLKHENNYLQFTFELGSDRSHLIPEFINKFIDSYIACGLEVATICPICHNKIENEQKVSIIDISGILTPVHEDCYESGKEEARQKAIKKNQEINKDTKGYKNGLVGAIIYGLIYMAILIVSFFFVQFVLENAESGDNFIIIFQYAPVLMALFACPLIYKGYDNFKGTKGTTKYIIILWTVIITTLLGTFFGFVASLLVLDTGNSFEDLLKLVVQLITCKDIKGSTSFRWGFYLYIIIALGLSILSMVFKFSGKEEMEEANSGTFEKLD